MHFFSSSDVLALMERIKFNIEIQRVFSERYVCISGGGVWQRWAKGTLHWHYTRYPPSTLFLSLSSRREEFRFSFGVLTIFMCFNNLLSFILINNIRCNDHFKISTVKLILLPSSWVFLTSLYPGKHLKYKTRRTDKSTDSRRESCEHSQ